MTKDQNLLVMSSGNTLLKNNMGLHSSQARRGIQFPAYNWKKIHSIFGNLVCTYNIKDTYLDKDYLWSVILAAAVFSI